MTARAVTGAVVMLLALGGCAADAATGPTDGAEEPATETAAVVREDLTTTEKLDGRLGYGRDTALLAVRGGTLTYLPEEGAIVRRGEALYGVDGTLTRLLHGDVPAWRSLAVGVADGPDVEQLERNLVAMGYLDESKGTPDGHYDWRTREGVRRWQRDLGVSVTGAVEHGDVTFAPSDRRIAGHTLVEGGIVAPGQEIATATGTEQVVTVEATASGRGLVAAGQTVGVELPGGARVDGTVTRVGQVATVAAEEGAEPTFAVEITLSAVPGEGFDAAPVTVHVARVLAAGVLTVPVGALLALDDGGYAVERVTAAGIELVAVETGQFTDARVEVTGDLSPGDEVVVPS